MGERLSGLLRRREGILRGIPRIVPALAAMETDGSFLPP